MNNPYQILGVNPNATEAAIKEAYRNQAVKYSTGEYANSPMAETAAERMRELDEAFDQVMADRRLGDQNQSEPEPAYQKASDNTESYAYSDDGIYSDIRTYLSRGNVQTAEQKLNAIDSEQRTAEWYFLMGQVCYRKGWFDEAHRNYAAACSMAPGNSEYSAAYRQSENARETGSNGYSPYGNQRQTTGGMPCCGDLSSCLSCLCCMSLCDCCR